MARQHLYLFTQGFPFGPAEPWLQHELPFLAEEFDQVTLVVTQGKQGQQRPLPANVSLAEFPYHLSFVQRLRAHLAWGQPEVKAEKADALARLDAPLSAGVRNTLAFSWAKGRLLLRWLQRDWRRRGLQPQQVVLYSYWWNDMATGLARAKEKWPQVKAVCRAHRWDVFEEYSAVGYLPFRRYTSERLDRVAFISQLNQSVWEQALGSTFPSYTVARLGVPAPATTWPADLQPNLVSCSRAVPIKRVGLMLHALRHLAVPQLRYTHLGDGPELQALRAEAAKLLAEKPHWQVDFPGYATVPVQVYEKLQPSFLVLLSHIEGLPVVLMEALSCGMPVVATDVGAVSEIVEDGRNGWLLPADPSAELVAAKLAELLQLEPDAYQRVSAEATRSWEQHWDARKNYHHWSKLLVT